ncbi:hypothetical protein ACFOWM_06155 [Ferruginibacter yonginensis]|uniref:Uncharacterized protein n=1 Tax=Ferruginibacter yonginensis TaxID=1310416 RepID=A0ABV8QQT5_9BACT
MISTELVTNKLKLNKNNQCRFTQGYVNAVVCMIELDKVNTLTREIFLTGIGNQTLYSLKNKGVDEHDLQVLKSNWKALHQK